MFENLFLANDFLVIFVVKLAILSAIVLQIYALVKIKKIKRKYYIFLFVKMIEILFFKYDLLYMYFILFFVGVLFNTLLKILLKNISIKEVILGVILFSGVPLIIIFYILYLIPLTFFYEYLL